MDGLGYAMNKDGDQYRTIMLGQGDLAPDFSLTDNFGNVVKLSDFKNKKNVVVYFYPKDFTPGCTIEANEFTRDYEKFRQADIEIIGISPDSAESHLEFRERMKIPYLLAADPTNELSKQYGVYGLKNFMGKQYFGVTRSTFLIGKDGIILKVFTKVRPRGHSQEVLESFIL